MRSAIFRAAAFALGLLVGLPSIAAAQLDCQVPTRERVSTGTLNSPALAPIRKMALAVEAIVKRNAVFMAGKRPIRVRTTIDYALDQPRTAIVNVKAYNKEAWIAGECDVIPEADRGGGVSDGAIHIVINDPRTFFGGSLGDAEMEAFEEPARTGEVAGFPEYSGDIASLMSEGGRVPWTPVTVSQALDREERRLRARQDEWAKQKERPWLSEAKIQESYELLKKNQPCRGRPAARRDAGGGAGREGPDGRSWKPRAMRRWRKRRRSLPRIARRSRRSSCRARPVPRSDAAWRRRAGGRRCEGTEDGHRQSGVRKAARRPRAPDACVPRRRGAGSGAGPVRVAAPIERRARLRGAGGAVEVGRGQALEPWAEGLGS